MPNAKLSRDRILLGSIVTIQLVFSGFYIFDLGSEVLGWRSVPLSWEFREAVQLITIAALLLGSTLGIVAYANLARSHRILERKMLIARNDFHELIQKCFRVWGLTPSEREVGLFILKGLSNAEIAAVRGKSIGTVKAQVNAVFRKAGANGRAQLISLFMEDLIAD